MSIETLEEIHGTEDALVGSILFDPSQLVKVLDIVSPADLIQPELKAFLELLIDLDGLGQPISDIQLVLTQTKKRSLRISAARIAELFQAVPNAAHAAYYAQGVAEASRLRKLATLADSLRKELSKPKADSAEITDYATAKLKLIDTSASVELVDAGEAVALYDEGNQGSANVVLSGVPTYDARYNGAAGGELVAIGGRLGTGKTAFGWQWMVAALQQGQPCLFVSLEMNVRRLMQRHLASETGIDSLLIQKNDLSISHQQRIDEEKRRFAEYPVSIFAPPVATVKQVASAARLKRSGSGLAMIVVDYIQKLKPSRQHKDQRIEVAEISAELKSLALEMDVPILALTQLNRQADDKKLPRVSQIADSDNIGRDADQVLLLHRDDAAGVTKLIVAKHRYIADDSAIDLYYENGRYSEGKVWIP